MWYKLLSMELGQIDTYVDPGMEVKERERVVGLMSDEVKKLYTLAQNLEKSAVEDLVRARYTSNEQEQNEALLKAAELKEKSETVREIMWITIKDELKLWGEGIGIRKGFRIVIMPQRDVPDFLKFLGGLQ